MRVAFFLEKKMLNANKLVTRNQVLELLNISRSTLQRWELRTDLRFPERIAMGPKLVMWRRADVEAWFDARPRGVDGRGV